MRFMALTGCACAVAIGCRSDEPSHHRKSTSPPAPEDAAEQTFAPNRATALFDERHLVAAPAAHVEQWSGTYAGTLTLTGDVEGSMSYTFEIMAAARDKIHVKEAAIIDCMAPRSPSNPNLVACSGSYSTPVSIVDYDLAIGTHDGALDVALVAHNNRIFGTLRAKP